MWQLSKRANNELSYLWSVHRKYTKAWVYGSVSQLVSLHAFQYLRYTVYKKATLVLYSQTSLYWTVPFLFKVNNVLRRF